MSFTLDMSSVDAFCVIRNPRLLDETTPCWFRLIIRQRSVQDIEDFLLKSDPKGVKEGEDFDLELPLHFDYWMLAFIIPFPWKSRVTECSAENSTFRLSYVP